MREPTRLQLDVLTHDNGCRIDLSYTVIEHEGEVEVNNYYSSEGNIVEFAFNLENHTVTFKKAEPSPEKHQVNSEASPTEASPTEDDIPF
jgi:hypothetical protein